MERLQKYLAQAGIASRRKAEELILAGRVKVNGITITQLGSKIDPERDIVTFDQKPVKTTNKYEYYLLHKPLQVVTTMHDPQGRTKVTDLLKGIKTRVYPVGRLDYHTEGLLLLTNDGELAYRLMHPKYKVAKTYLVTVKGILDKNSLLRLQKGVLLEDGLTMPAKVTILETGEDYSRLEMTIREGRNRQVRRMCEAVGHPVVSLKRVKFGPLSLGQLKPGQYRKLEEGEIRELKKACQL
ncbi:MAG: pseudouridine synthase [Bacillota bacterium]|uniref:Pseudouridine synthase n=1 Tax=Thermanaerosceptrum fracticalcis TaxID=1712410 RepID=A0A7G6E0I0_THEFR|nr:pseudouridine synthase [Thermanaerosceptrum fracticalcis]QNB45584.1 pseudouridine synthase [Thermanaerosceptrum fracticalcis]